MQETEPVEFGAGEIASWAGEQLAGNVAGYVITNALTYLGVEGTDDVDAQLTAMNAKLDQILTQMDVLNTKWTNSLRASASLPMKLMLASKWPTPRYLKVVSRRFTGRSSASLAADRPPTVPASLDFCISPRQVSEAYPPPLPDSAIVRDRYGPGSRPEPSVQRCER